MGAAEITVADQCPELRPTLLDELFDPTPGTAKRLANLLRAKPLAWTTAPPAEPGWYWWRHNDNYPREQCVWVGQALMCLTVSIAGHGTFALDGAPPGSEWCGPLTPPE